EIDAVKEAEGSHGKKGIERVEPVSVAEKHGRQSPRHDNNAVDERRGEPTPEPRIFRNIVQIVAKEKIAHPTRPTSPTSPTRPTAARAFTFQSAANPTTTQARLTHASAFSMPAACQRS